MRRKHFLLSLLLLLVGVVSASAQTYCTEISHDGWTIKGSSYHGEGAGYGYHSLIDDNTGTYWHSNWGDGEGKANTLPQWIVIDLGAERTFEAIGVQRRQGNNNSVKNYRVYVSNEDFTSVSCPATTQAQIDAVKNLGTTNLVKSGTFGGGTNDVYVDFLNTEATGRYVLFVVDNTHSGGNYVCMSEFMLYTVDEKTRLQDKTAQLQSLVNVAPVGTTFGYYPSNLVTDAQNALTTANGVLTEETSTTAQIYSALPAVETAYAALEPARVGYGELFVIKNTGNNNMAIYNSGCILEEGSSTVVLSNWNNYDRRSFFKLDVAQIADGQAYFTIRSAVDATQYVYAINTGNADSNVGVKSVADGTVVDDMLWKFVANGSGWNIIPKGGSYSWNGRGSYGGNAHIGQRNNNDNAHNIWRVESTEEFILAEKVVPYVDSEGKIGGIANVAASTEAAKALAATLRSSFTDANLTAYKNFVSAWKTPANGLYKVYNKGIHKYLFSESSDNTKNITLINDGGDNAKYYWKVSFNGNAATIMGSTGLSMAKGNTSASYANATTNYISPVNMQPAQGDAVWTEGYFLLPNVHSTEQNKFTKNNADYASATNPYFLTTWTTTTGANQYAFEPVTLSGGAEIYTVEMIGAEGSLTYNDAEYEGNATVYNGGFYVLTSKPSAGDFTASTVSGYTPEVAINGNSITVTYAINDGVKLYSPKARASALKTDGTKYMIYNATSNDDRYGMYHNNGSNNIQKSGVHPSGVKTLNDAYLFTLEAEMNEGTATGKYYIKSVSGNTYFNINGTINNSTGQALNIKEYSTSTHKPGTDNFTGDNGGTTVGAAAITSDQKFWAVELDNVGSNAGCWNGNPDTYAQWETSHALAFYEVEEMDANTELADEIALLDEVLSKTGVGYPAQNVRKTLAAAITAAQNSVNAPAAYTAAINTYKNSTDIELPEDGKAYVLTNKHKTYGNMHLNYDAADDNLKFAERGTGEAQDLPMSAHFVCHKLANGKYVFVNNNGKYIVLKELSDGHNSNKGVVGVYEERCDATIAKDPAEFGALNLTLKRKNGNNSYIIHSNTTSGFNQGGGPYNDATNSTVFFFEEVDYPCAVNFTAAIGEDYVATFAAPFPTVVPENVEAYAITGQSGEYAALSEPIASGNAIPAGEGVLLVSKSAMNNVAMVPATTESTANMSGNLLERATGEAISESTTAYILANGSNGVGFYQLSADDREVGMNKAYLTGLSGAAVLKLNFGGNLTGIDSIENGELTIDNGTVYDLSGRVVNAPVKGGIYIKNGKKYIVK